MTINYLKLYCLDHLLSLDFFMLLKDLNVLFLFVITAAGVVPCGGRKMYPRTHLYSSVDYILLSAICSQ